MALLEHVIIGFWLVIPAYVANGLAPVARGSRPLDGGRSWGKNRIFGDGKTWEGTLFGIAAGTAIGFLEIMLYPQVSAYGAARGFTVPQLSVAAVVAISAGAMLGDLIASFVKRRLGMPRGDSFPIIDQLDFVTGAFIAASFFVTLGWAPVLFVYVVTPLIHLVANYIGHRFGIKNVPW